MSHDSLRHDGKFKGVCLACNNSSLRIAKCDFFAQGIPHRSLTVPERDIASGYLHEINKKQKEERRKKPRKYHHIILEERLVMAEHNAFLCPVCQNRCVICNKYGLVPPFWDRCVKCTEKSVQERKAVHNVDIVIDTSLIDMELLVEAKMLESADEEEEI